MIIDTLYPKACLVTSCTRAQATPWVGFRRGACFPSKTDWSCPSEGPSVLRQQSANKRITLHTRQLGF
eukprot:6317046-Amphidinium_carterae.1